MTNKRIRFLQAFLGLMGLEGRLHLEWISSSEAKKFVQVITEFTEKIKAMGPNPISGRTGLTVPGQSIGLLEEKKIAAIGG